MSNPEYADSLNDAGTAAGEVPAPTSEQSQLFKACTRVIAAQRACESHHPKKGPEWVAKAAEYREAWSAFTALFGELNGAAA